MTSVDLETLNRRTAISAARQEAARIGADGDVLLDSKQLYDRVTGLNPDEPGFLSRVRDLVGEAAGRRAGQPSAASPQKQPERPRQWTLGDVNKLPRTREGAAKMQAAIDDGLLADLGYPPFKHRGY